MMGQRRILIAFLLLGCIDGVRGQDAVAQRRDAVAQMQGTVAQRQGAPVHIVVRGETLSHIARARGTTVDDLKRLNGLSGDLIRIGQVLLLQPGVRAPVAGLASPARGMVNAAALGNTTGMARLRIPATMTGAVDSFDTANRAGAAETPDARTSADAADAADAIDAADAPDTADALDAADAPDTADGLDTAGARSPVESPETMIRETEDVAGGEANLSVAAMTFAAGGVSAYVVEEQGETLYSITGALGTKAYILHALNDGLRAPLEPGTVLVIPASASEAAWTSGAAAGGDPMQGGAPPFAVGSVTVLPETYAGTEMASGRVYEPAAFVVAHRELPFDTILIVENGTTGRASFARVADRHPREEGVLLAISPALASEIGVESGDYVRIRLVE